MLDLKTIQKIHFVGIGGIGISAMARMMLSFGKQVTGNDLDDFDLCKMLRIEGVDMRIGATFSLIPPGTELVVYSVAWNDLAPELIAEIRAQNIPMRTYPEMLEIVSAGMKTIAISGTHGKTTTTAMVGKLMRDLGLDPTIIVGSLLKPKDLGISTAGVISEKGTNFVGGKSEYLVVEADEYRKAFLHLSPYILVINNIALDHLDFYPDLSAIQDAFREMVSRIPEDGAVVFDDRAPDVLPVLSSARCRLIPISSVTIPEMKLSIPGEHNRANARMAFVVGTLLHFSPAKMIASLESFSGTWRRFDYVGETKTGALVYDDYAHNPDKIRSALQGAREMFPDRTIWAIFQPHLFSRTKSLLSQFAESFDDADHVIVLPIYAGREAFDDSIRAEQLVDLLKTRCASVEYISNFSAAQEFVIQKTNPGDVIVAIGAGDVCKLAEELVP